MIQQTSFLTPGALTEESFQGYYSWSPLTASRLIAKDDGAHTSSDVFNTNYHTKVLRLRNFGFSLPSNAMIIMGTIVVRVRASLGGIVVPQEIYVVGDGTGVNARTVVVDPSNGYDSTIPIGETYEDREFLLTGSQGSFIPASQVNSPNFGIDVAFRGIKSGSASVYVDYVGINFMYGLSAGPSPRRRPTQISIID
jgi:hypothetical protein